MNADLLIMDERDGRKEAISQDLKVAGMLGIFLQATEKNEISSVKPYLDKLRLTHFMFSPVLYDQVLVLAGKKSVSKKA